MLVGVLFKTPTMFHNGGENSCYFKVSPAEYMSAVMGLDNSNIHWLILTLTQAVQLSKNDIWKISGCSKPWLDNVNSGKEAVFSIIWNC